MFLLKRLLLLVLLVMSLITTFAQNNNKLDSFKKRVAVAKEDSNKVKLLIAFADAYLSSDPTAGLKKAHEAEVLSGKIKWQKGLADAKMCMASGFMLLSKFNETEKSLRDAGSIYDRVGDQQGKTKVLILTGKLNLTLGKYPEAVQSSMNALKTAEDLKDDKLIAQACAIIAGANLRQKNFEVALKYYNRALTLYNKIGDKKGTGSVLSNIGAINLSTGQLDTALVILKKALAINEEAGAKDIAAMNIANIAGIYMAQNKYNQSLSYSFRSLRINEQMGDRNNIGIDQLNIGVTYFHAVNDSNYVIVADSLMPSSEDQILKKAIQYLEAAEKNILSVSGDINALREVYLSLSNAHEKAGNLKIALGYFQTYQKYQDSIFSSDQRLKIADLETQQANREKQKQIELNKVILTKKRNERVFFSIGIMLLVIAIVFVTRERRRSDKLLLNILPAEVAQELKKKGGSEAKYFDEVTVLFTDFVNFTVLAEKLNPQALVDELHTCFKAFDGIMGKYNIEKIKTVGDAYLAVSGLPVADKNHAINVVSAAKEIIEFIAQRRIQKGENTFEIRIGVHSGSVVAGIVGVKKFAYDIWGDTVNTAARMEQASEAGKINISQATYELVKDHFQCTSRGEHEVKNKGKMEMYFVS